MYHKMKVDYIKTFLYISFILLPCIFIWAHYYDTIFNINTEDVFTFKFAFDKNNEIEKSSLPASLMSYNSMWITNQYEKENKRNCVVLSATIPNFSNNTIYIKDDGKPTGSSVSWGYVFLLPLTVRAWRQMNYHVVTFIVLDNVNIDKNASKLLSIVHEKLVVEKVTIIYVNIKSKLKMRISQLIRLVPAGLNLFPDDVFITTSDADIWPARDPRYDIPDLNKIHITNHLSCGEFEFNNIKYREYPMTTIAMTVKLWKKVFNLKHFFAKKDQFDMDLFLQDIQKYFKDDVYQPASHGNTLWSIDQRYASILINDYNRSAGNDILSFYMKPGCRRLTPDNINSINSSSCVGDVHTLKGIPWSSLHEWPIIHTVRTIMFDKETMRQQDEYAKMFENAFNMMNRRRRVNE